VKKSLEDWLREETMEVSHSNKNLGLLVASINRSHEKNEVSARELRSLGLPVVALASDAEEEEMEAEVVEEELSLELKEGKEFSESFLKGQGLPEAWDLLATSGLSEELEYAENLEEHIEPEELIDQIYGEKSEVNNVLSEELQLDEQGEEKNFSEPLEIVEESVKQPVEKKRGEAFVFRHRTIIGAALGATAVGAYFYYTHTTPEVLLDRGNRYFNDGQYERALNYYNWALKKEPYFIEALLALGRVLENAGDKGEAIDAYFRVLQQDPENSIAYLRLGDLFFSLNSKEKALQSYNEVLRRDRTNLQALLGAAHCFFDKEDFKNALPLYQEALQLQPENEEILKKITSIQQFFLKEEAMEEEKLRTALIEERKGLAKRALLFQHYREAEQYYREILELSPDDDDALRGRAFCFESMEDYGKALEFYEVLLEKHPDEEALSQSIEKLKRSMQEKEKRREHEVTKMKEGEIDLLPSKPSLPERGKRVPVYSGKSDLKKFFAPQSVALSVEAEKKRNSRDVLIERMKELCQQKQNQELLRTGWEYLFTLEKASQPEGVSLVVPLSFPKSKTFLPVRYSYEAISLGGDVMIQNQVKRLDSLRRAIEINPGDRQVYLMMCQAWDALQNEQVENSGKSQNIVVSNEAFYSSLLAHAAFQADRPKEAWEAIERARKLAPDNLFIARFRLVLANSLNMGDKMSNPFQEG
jgi:tetratricopeptide (TPR) repeat protein